MEWEKLLNSSRRKNKNKIATSNKSQEIINKTYNKTEWRQEIERDFDRILFATPTRRLADKTQVYPLDRNDSVRTRLTHSHEVANFARGIGMRLAFDHKQEIFGALDELVAKRDVPALLAAIGLAHDLGNPPFGHQGEAAMRDWFRLHLEPLIAQSAEAPAQPIYNDFYEFDGNSQTIRLVTKLQILNDRFGLNLTYATLAALIKYPRNSYSSPKNKWKKHGYFYSEYKIIQDVWNETGLREGVRHPFTYIMEACDDIAYSILDAEDTVKKTLASYQDLINHLRCWEKGNDEVINQVIKETEEKNSEYEALRQALSPAELNDMSMQMFRVKCSAAMINCVVEAFCHHSQNMLTGECDIKDLLSKSRARTLGNALKNFDKTRGYRHKSVLELELKGANYIQGLMDMLWIGIHGHKTQREREKEQQTCQEKRDEYRSNSPFGRYVYSQISENYRRIFEDEDDELPVLYKEAQLLSDAISGMTDGYLITLHDELKSLYEYESRQQK